MCPFFKNAVNEVRLVRDTYMVMDSQSSIEEVSGDQSSPTWRQPHCHASKMASCSARQHLPLRRVIGVCERQHK